MEVRDRRGGVTVVTEDETVKTAKFDKIPKLKPCFKSDGSVTAASSSPLSDGACALVLMSAARAKALNVTALARVLSSADATQTPELFTTSPALAVPKAVTKAGLTLDDMTFFEINEAFAVVALANMKLLNLEASTSKVNIFGGAVAMGHPLGMLALLCSARFALLLCVMLTYVATLTIAIRVSVDVLFISGCSGARIVCTLLTALTRSAEEGSSTKPLYGCAAICNGGGGATALVIQKI